MNKISKFTIGGIFAVALFIRCISIDFSKLDDYIITNYDGLGYYMYLPAIFIYQDITQFEWIEDIDSKYKVAGDDWMFQISKHENGNYVTKYLGGIAFLQLPFFLVAHGYALLSDYPADGFSTPYQLSLSIGPLVYFILILFLLRKILLRYYDDDVVAWTLGLLFIASNALEYIAIEAGHSHGYILLMYTLVIGLSIKWHEGPKVWIALALGLTIGGATIMRPTELIIFLIPLLWNTQTKESAKEKWALVRKHKKHMGWLCFGALLGALPQVLYWLYVTGSPIHTIGSKWYFLNPYFRVLFGWQKGWFIYTPITIFFVLGLFFMKRKPFRKSVIWFCVLNIWIVISWSVWRYGGSYSTRALVQSYPVFALALAGWISWVNQQKWRYLFYTLVIYLSAVNLFQIWQYRQGILRHDEMNRSYYQAVYLDKDPTPLDMSMLDGGEIIKFPCTKTEYLKNVVPRDEIQAGSVFFKADLQEGDWMDAQMELRTTRGFWKGFIVVQFLDEAGKEMEKRAFRMFNHLTRSTQINSYQIQFKMPTGASRVEFKFGGGADVAAEVRSLVVKKCI
ncbi:MAG: hypothetical protein P1U56_08670 [Saprospiraceae bacterium]|nr:hypothetical protein [Saprospiraceae bacterium]